MEVRFGPGEITAVAALLGAVVGAMVFVFKLYVASKDAALADWKSIAADAGRMLEASEARRRKAEGKPPLPNLAPVIPEHQSPPTKEQNMVAQQQTLRALVTAVGLDLGIPSRGAPPEDHPRTEEPASDNLITKAEAITAIVAIEAKANPGEAPTEAPEEKRTREGPG